MKIVFLDSDTMGDVSFAPIEKAGELILYPRSTPEGELMSDFMPRRSSKVEIVQESSLSPSGVIRSLFMYLSNSTVLSCCSSCLICQLMVEGFRFMSWAALRMLPV